MIDMHSLLEEQEFIKNLGIRVPSWEILAEYKKIPWWKRLFMTSNRKKLEKAKITLDKITNLQSRKGGKP